MSENLDELTNYLATQPSFLGISCKYFRTWEEILKSWLSLPKHYSPYSQVFIESYARERKSWSTHQLFTSSSNFLKTWLYFSTICSKFSSSLPTFLRLDSTFPQLVRTFYQLFQLFEDLTLLFHNLLDLFLKSSNFLKTWLHFSSTC